MATVLITLLFTTLGAHFIVKSKAKELCHPQGVLIGLYWYHLLFFLLYYAYATNNNSDSKSYYQKLTFGLRGDTWLDFYGVGTPFVEFVAYPFVKYLGFSYEAIMLLFAFAGFVGFIYFYLFLTRFLHYKHKLFKLDVILLLMFLPNMHFWTVSLGKGAAIFLGLGMFFYGLVDFRKNWLPLLIGSVIIFHIRAHIMLVIILAILISAIFSSKGIKNWQKVLIIIVSLIVLSPVANTFIEYARIEETDAEGITNFIQHRGSELGKATSSVDINNYNQFSKLFTFLFRPLFFDAPNVLGLIVSFENLFYLLMFLRVLSFRFLKYVLQAHWLVKTSFIVFIGVTIALAQISGNMGIAIRQKAQIMYLVFFVILAYADHAYRTTGELVIGE